MSARINIIGMGAGAVSSLTDENIQIIKSCDILMGASRFLDQFTDVPARKITITANLTQLIDIIHENPDKNIVVAASGDPNFYGISDFILKHIPARNVVITPNISSMQLAFAAAKVTMTNATIVSIHGRTVKKVLQAVKNSKKIGVFTSDEQSPHLIANLLTTETNEEFDIFICEDMGYKTQRIVKTNLHSIGNFSFSPLNIVILIKKETCLSKNKIAVPSYGFLGIPDEEFYHRDGMLTKAEVRVLAISKLRLYPGMVLWDIGAGSGSISIEAALLMSRGRIFSIEKDYVQQNNIEKNCKKFDCQQITIIRGTAPDVLQDLPAPDRVFIGGSDGQLQNILAVCSKVMPSGGVVVINAVTLDTLIESSAALKKFGFSFELVTVNISRIKNLKENKFFKAINPVSIIAGIKKG